MMRSFKPQAARRRTQLMLEQLDERITPATTDGGGPGWPGGGSSGGGSYGPTAGPTHLNLFKSRDDFSEVREIPTGAFALSL